MPVPAQHPERSATPRRLGRGAQSKDEANTLPPFFSIIVPTFARPKALSACLSAVVRLNYPRERYEVVVVDDGGPASQQSVIDSARDQIAVLLIAQPHAGPAAARNTGAGQARGEYLAFIDDDCAPDHDWLAKIAARLTAAPASAVGGQTINALPGNPYAAASQSLIDYLYSHYNSDPNHARFFASNNLALPRKQFRELGGFDPRFPFAAGEDRDLCDRWLNNGWPMAHAPEAVVQHAHALTLRAFWRQQFNYGSGTYYFHRLRAQRARGPIRFERFSFYVGLLTHPFRASQPGLAPLVWLAQVANAAGYARARLADRP